ncbi:hypothetical protein HCH_01382 [Hahella chejuensis KCTC 2396]|uniref:Uncharacterized protein n=1 Tax=Hahella chejuensis (strain KCTC 2396) TaxID=349521 RepID=Q2SM79_HAHCH|nr:hypothetical protein HCH_01382 [Hahella chejuensis KCTC 2396]
MLVHLHVVRSCFVRMPYIKLLIWAEPLLPGCKCCHCQAKGLK